MREKVGVSKPRKQSIVSPSSIVFTSETGQECDKNDRAVVPEQEMPLPFQNMPERIPEFLPVLFEHRVAVQPTSDDAVISGKLLGCVRERTRPILETSAYHTRASEIQNARNNVTTARVNSSVLVP